MSQLTPLSLSAPISKMGLLTLTTQGCLEVGDVHLFTDITGGELRLREGIFTS